MKEKPMLFIGPMVRATLEDRKNQTRRVMKNQPPFPWKTEIHGDSLFVLDGGWKKFCKVPHPAGSRIWVKETWATASSDAGPCVCYRADCGRIYVDEHFGFQKVYHDSSSKHLWANWARDLESGVEGKWRPSIFMPRWASRINLEVTEVRVERLQEITRKDAEAEGVCTDDYFDRLEHAESCAPPGSILPSPRSEYQRLWNQINGPGSWDQNPWVWVYTFRRVK